MNVLIALVAGIVVGIIFKLVGVPAPPTLAGILGIVGLFAGYNLGNLL